MIAWVGKAVASGAMPAAASSSDDSSDFGDATARLRSSAVAAATTWRPTARSEGTSSRIIAAGSCRNDRLAASWRQIFGPEVDATGTAGRWIGIDAGEAEDEHPVRSVAAPNGNTTDRTAAAQVLVWQRSSPEQ